MSGVEPCPICSEENPTARCYYCHAPLKGLYWCPTCHEYFTSREVEA